jgi:hypothetical protein
MQRRLGPDKSSELRADRASFPPLDERVEDDLIAS